MFDAICRCVDMCRSTHLRHPIDLSTTGAIYDGPRRQIGSADKSEKKNSSPAIIARLRQRRAA